MNLPEPVNSAPPAVTVDIGESILGEDEALAILKEHGLANLTSKALVRLKQLGVFVNGAGTVGITRGSVMVNQQRLDAAMRVLHSEILELAADKSKKGRVTAMQRLCASLGYLSGKMVEAQKFMIELEMGRSASDMAQMVDASVRSFAPAQVIKPGTTLVIGKEVHMHQEQPAS